jgi:vancomycin permeability regulator SanA
MTMKLLLILTILGFLFLTLPRLVTGIYSRMRIYTGVSVPMKRIAIVFGAGLWSDGSPTPILQDRVKAAADLFFNGKVEKILMSGDNRVVEYNEPLAMREFALSLGVPEDAIVLDYAGRRTYDTCYRAKAIFGLIEATLVTQSFHLPRALYICSKLGLDVVGVSADLQVYRKRALIYWNMRELVATGAALWDVHFRHPVPVLGDYEPIFP